MVRNILKNDIIDSLEVGLWVAAFLAILCWTFWPAGKAAYATLTLKKVSKQLVEQGTQRVHLEIQREVQKHYLSNGVYIPLEDIFFVEEIKQTNPDLTSAIVKSCGNATMAIWVPLLVRLPYIGERSFEWCWKPSLIN